VNYISTLLIALLLAVPAMAIEMFRYGGAARDGGTLELHFRDRPGGSPTGRDQKESGRDRSELYDDLLPHPDRRPGDPGVPHNAGHILDGLLFGPVDKRTSTRNVLRRRPAQRNDC
jgi:hypothetical protein